MHISPELLVRGSATAFPQRVTVLHGIEGLHRDIRTAQHDWPRPRRRNADHRWIDRLHFVIQHFLRFYLSKTEVQFLVEGVKETMRSTLIFLIVACGTAFCQDSANPAPANDALSPQNDAVSPQEVRAAGNAITPPQSVRIMTVTPERGICSIPLLNAFSPGKPVAMPTVSPEGKPRTPGQLTPGQPTQKQKNATSRIDKMTIVAPAPACQSRALRIVAPLTPPPA